MGEETALGHANMIGQYTDGNAGKTGSAQKVQAGYYSMTDRIFIEFRFWPVLSDRP
jgi:hypothetical protein